MATRMETTFPRTTSSGRHVNIGRIALVAVISISVLAGVGTIGYLWRSVGDQSATIPARVGGIQAGVASAPLSVGAMYAGLDTNALKAAGYTGRLGVSTAWPFVPGSTADRCVGGWSGCGESLQASAPVDLGTMYAALNRKALEEVGYTGRLGAVTHNWVVPGR